MYAGIYSDIVNNRRKISNNVTLDMKQYNASMLI
jgi:hypothetical protein